MFVTDVLVFHVLVCHFISCYMLVKLHPEVPRSSNQWSLFFCSFLLLSSPPSPEKSKKWVCVQCNSIKEPLGGSEMTHLWIPWTCIMTHKTSMCLHADVQPTDIWSVIRRNLSKKIKEGLVCKKKDKRSAAYFIRGSASLRCASDSFIQKM